MSAIGHTMASMPHGPDGTKARGGSGISTPRTRSNQGGGRGGGRDVGSGGESGDGKHNNAHGTPRGQNINHVSICDISCTYQRVA